MKYRLLDIAADVLEDAPEPLTYTQIWNLGVQKDLVEKLTHKSVNPRNTLSGKLSNEIIYNGATTKFIRTQKPYRYFLRSRQHELDMESIDSHQHKVGTTKIDKPKISTSGALRDLAYKVLKDAPSALTYRGIWDLGVQRGVIKRENYNGATPWLTLSSQLSTEIRNNPTGTRFIKVGKYYSIKGRKIDATKENEPPIQLPRQPTYLEKDLHPLLAYFAYANPEFSGERQIHTKTIRHHISTSNAPKEWLHPDMVGVYFPFGDMNAKVIRLSGYFNSSSMLQMFSFELKRTINKRNYRETFFQAVSNSSWANQGYLVAAEVDEDDELRRELSRLTNSFGIGIIHLNLEDIDASRVLFDAATRRELDWETIDKLCTVNKDFENFIKRLNIDFKSNTIHLTEYDKVIDKPIAYIRKTLKVKTVD